MTDPHDHTVSILPGEGPPAPIGGFAGADRFELRGILGEGGFGTVFRAFDRERDELVALKLMRRTSADSLYRFKREFRVAAGLSHPNVIPLYALFTASEQWFFTMPLIAGQPLLEWINGSIPRLRASMGQLVAALGALHAAGITHRDVKPSNVLVDDAGRVVLLDLGLARSMADGDSTIAAGTPRYMSPEQCAGGEIGPACDVYALGVILFEAIAAQPPFDGTSHAVIRAKLERDPPSLATVAQDAPPDLIALTQALLARDPAARPPLAEIADRLGAQIPIPAAPEPTFVGRRAESTRIRAAIAAAAAGRPTVVLVDGPSGIGKSALMAASLREARAEPDALVFVGRCHPNESVPYKALDALMDHIARRLERMPVARVARLLPTDPAALTALFPVLGAVPSMKVAPAATDAATPASRQRRAAEALREMLARMAAQGPVVLALDDLQWGDADSADLLRRVLRPPAAPGICLLATTRDGPADQPVIGALAEIAAGGGLALERLTLGPLPPQDGAALAQAVLAPSARPSVEGIVRRAGGSPFFIVALASLGASGEIGDVGTLVERHLQTLGADARAALEAVVIAGQPLDAALIGQACEVAGVQASLDQLVSRRLLGQIGVADARTYIAWHAKIADVIAAGLDPARRRALHLALARALEATGGADPEHVARHFDAGGHPERAARYVVAAARRAMDVLAYERAADLWRRALALAADADRAPLLEALADALAATGRAIEAAETYLEVVPLLDDDARAHALRCEAGSLLLLGGQTDRGRTVLAAGLQRFGRILGGSTGALLWRISASRLGVRLGRLRDAQPTIADRERLDALWAAGAGISISDPLAGMALLSVHRRLAMRVLEPVHRARAVAIRAIDLSLTQGARAQAQCHALLADARVLAAELDDPELTALVPAAEGLVAAMGFQFEEAARLLPLARQVAYDVGRLGSYGADVAALMYTSVLFEMGDVAALRDDAPPLIEEMERRGHLICWTLARMHLSVALLYGDGDVDGFEAIVEGTKARWAEADVGTMQQWWMSIADATVLLHQGRATEAWQALHFGRTASLARRLFSTRFLYISETHMQGRIALASAAEDAAARRPMLRATAGFARRLLQEAHPWPRALGMALEAGAASIRGERAAAIALLAEADPLFDAARLKLLRATAHLARARLLGEPEGAHFRERAEAWFAANDVRGAELALRSLLPGRWGRPVGERVDG